ncbi:hypothetical protein B0T26DRAFT_783094 [Lasiosphaeria miniovina]|uniref:FAD-binding domain-containing protein n=1 Tax=Lasiosphaeria miniovina TaxID=1954250 RepID=A0AA40DUC8_9PEZI|nr:uncharacterized protein B0T26DRAFT_783094 [Lasiosphaeria miniovina]KAK0713707.1 hypothetical protein B0T26DRAFT_783094 [Lasiosphaeria miniovina]
MTKHEADTPGHSPGCEIAIIGGGITGVTLALALDRRRIRCTIYEQAAQFRELGAGLGFGSNALRAMHVCDERVLAAYRRVGRHVGAPAGPVWIEFLDGTSPVAARELAPAFTIHAPADGHGAVHRARYLDELVRLLPAGAVRFGKRLHEITQPAGGGKLTMLFSDGTTARADAVVGCDGIKSRTREIVAAGLKNGEEVDARCGYSGKFAYRCLIPMDRVVEELGEARAREPSLWMGPDRHVLTFPIGPSGPGQLLNLVAFVDSGSRSWPSETSLTLPATREDVVRDFRGFGQNVQRLLGMMQAPPDRWGLFDLLDRPLVCFNHGRVLVIGDAAHASTPHHGSGAGFCMEDVAVLASLLEDLDTQPLAAGGAAGLEAAFAALDASRRERCQWLVASSRRSADVMEWREPSFTRGPPDFDAIRRDMETRQSICWDVDMKAMVRAAKEDLRRRINQPQASSELGPQ